MNNWPSIPTNLGFCIEIIEQWSAQSSQRRDLCFDRKGWVERVSLAFWKIVSWKVSLAERNCFFHPPTLHGNERWAVFGKRRPKRSARSITLACRGRCFSQIKVAGTSVISAGLYGCTNVVKPGGGRASQIIRLKAQGYTKSLPI